MKIIRILSAASALFLIGSYTVAGAADSCTYVQENMFAGPFDVCQEPADEARCEEIGQTDDNTDAVHGGGACSVESVIGTCDLGDSKVIYYTGEASGLEIGCGFQGGDWITAE